ncbi:MAG: HEPN domain-containing protein [Victivallales bacterium]|jgi:uncharacterized protein (UPF0332 family)
MNKELVKYRLDRANEALEEAALLANNSKWNTCVNRLYYSCFYAVSALLAKDDMSSSKHTGVRSLFNLHYVKSNKVPKELAQIYNDLFEKRQEGDYIDFVRFEEPQVKPLISGAKKFIAHIKTLI